jgi:hypothetical protein
VDFISAVTVHSGEFYFLIAAPETSSGFRFAQFLLATLSKEIAGDSRSPPAGGRII